MIKFPLTFEVFSEATSEINSLWQGGSNGLPNVPCAIPREFHGPGGGYTPQDFFALAQLSCTIAMFKVMCEKSGVTFKSLIAKAKLVMDQDPDTCELFIKQIDFSFEIKGASDKQKLKKLLESSLNKGPICGAVKTPKTVKLSVS